MKKMYVVLWSFLAIVMAGCYQDKGNYDYKNIDELTISFEKSHYTLTLGEELKLNPKINPEVDLAPSRYTFAWYLDGKTRPEWNRHSFSWVADELLANKYVALEITDLTSHVTYMNRVGLTVQGVYETDNSWMILSDTGGKSKLSFFSIQYDKDKEKYTDPNFIEDVYALVSDEELGHGPIALQEHFRKGIDRTDNVVGNVCVFQESGAVDLSGESFAKQIDMVKTFDGGVSPAGVTAFCPGTFMDMIDVIADQRGRLYSRIKSSALSYNTEYFLPNPLTYGDETAPVEQCQVARGYYRANRTGYAFIYDGKNKRMLYILNSGYDDDEIMGIGRLKPLPACGKSDDPAKIVPLDHMEGYKLIKMMMCGVSLTGGDKWTSYYGFYLLLQDELTNDLWLQKVTVSGSNGKPVVEEVTRWKVSGLPGIPALMTCPLKKPEYIFFAVGHSVYYQNLNNTDSPVVLYKSFDAPVTALNAETEADKYMAVGLETGDFYLLTITEAQNVEESKKVIYHSDKKVGRIVDIRYKQMDHWNY